MKVLQMYGAPPHVWVALRTAHHLRQLPNAAISSGLKVNLGLVLASVGGKLRKFRIGGRSARKAPKIPT